LNRTARINMFTAQIKDHFENPRNSGEVSNPDASVLLQNPVCGDVLQITLRVSHEHIEEIRFRAQGCVPLIACASVLTELAVGQTINTARALHFTQIVEALGGLPSASTHAGHLAIKALAAALDQIDLEKIPEPDSHLSAHT